LDAIFRESNGLAMSSRNERLTEKEPFHNFLNLKSRKRKIQTNSANGRNKMGRKIIRQTLL
jgi:pantothenate synthetase